MENLKESGLRFRRLFEASRDGMIVINSKTDKITDVNPFLEKLLGYSKSEFLNKKIWEVTPFKTLQKTDYESYKVLHLKTKNGNLIDVEFLSNSYMAGNVILIHCNIRDITERKKAESLGEKERQMSEEMLKRESFADATHELRTPLAIIKGNVDLALLGKGKNKKSPKSALRAINYEVKHLASILSDLTLLTSPTGELRNKTAFEKLNLESLLMIVKDRCETLAYKKNISIIVKKIPNLSIFGDKFYLEKMLLNLVKNSIIYGNRNGHTKIEAYKSNGFIEINITDDGIGISEEDMPHIFERFYRADKSHNGKSTGLGLAIVKWVAEIHGGHIKVKSEINKGTVFNISFLEKTKNNK